MFKVPSFKSNNTINSIIMSSNLYNFKVDFNHQVLSKVVLHNYKFPQIKRNNLDVFLIETHGRLSSNTKHFVPLYRSTINEELLTTSLKKYPNFNIPNIKVCIIKQKTNFNSLNWVELFFNLKLNSKLFSCPVTNTIIKNNNSNYIREFLRVMLIESKNSTLNKIYKNIDNLKKLNLSVSNTALAHRDTIVVKNLINNELIRIFNKYKYDFLSYKNVVTKSKNIKIYTVNGTLPQYNYCDSTTPFTTLSMLIVKSESLFYKTNFLNKNLKPLYTYNAYVKFLNLFNVDKLNFTKNIHFFKNINTNFNLNVSFYLDIVFTFGFLILLCYAIIYRLYNNNDTLSSLAFKLKNEIVNNDSNYLDFKQAVFFFFATIINIIIFYVSFNFKITNDLTLISFLYINMMTLFSYIIIFDNHIFVFLQGLFLNPSKSYMLFKDSITLFAFISRLLLQFVRLGFCFAVVFVFQKSIQHLSLYIKINYVLNKKHNITGEFILIVNYLIELIDTINNFVSQYTNYIVFSLWLIPYLFTFIFKKNKCKNR